VSGQGVVVEGVKGVKQAPKAAQTVQKWCRNGQFPALIGLKFTKNAILYLKVL
jgi:hypothetical protein